MLLKFKFRSVATFGDGPEFPWQQEVLGCVGIVSGHRSRKTSMSTHASACPHADVHPPSSPRAGRGSSLQRSDIALLMTLVVNVIPCNLLLSSALMLGSRILETWKKVLTVYFSAVCKLLGTKLPNHYRMAHKRSNLIPSTKRGCYSSALSYTTPNVRTINTFTSCLRSLKISYFN